MPNIFSANVAAVIQHDASLVANIEAALRKISAIGSLGEITLSDRSRKGRIVVFEGHCSESQDVVPIRNGILKLYNRVHGTRFQISITRGKYGGDYGKFVPARSPKDYRSL